MRRIVVTSLLFILGALGSPLRAVSPLDGLEDRINKNISAPSSKKQNVPHRTPNSSAESFTPKTSHTSSSQQQQISQALRKVIFSPKDPASVNQAMMWSEFLSAAQEETTRTGKRLKSLDQALDDRWEVIKKVPMTLEYKRPNYGEYAKPDGQTPAFIYLADSAHRTQTLVNEVAYVLRSVRHAHPQARVLLALEGARLVDFEVPILFAGQENSAMKFSTPYNKLVSAAANSDVDILALDDSIGSVAEDAEDFAYYKVGKHLILMNVSDYPSFVKNPFEMTLAEWQKWGGFLVTSSLGVRYRNEQWADYISAVKPFYDIIITFAGDGHINSHFENWRDLPDLVGEPYVVFNFYTTERPALEQQFFEDMTYELLYDSQASLIQPIYPQKPEPRPAYSPDKWGKRTMEEGIIWDGKSILNVKRSQSAQDKYVQSLPAEQQQSYQKAKETLESAHRTDLEKATVDVFLPEWPKQISSPDGLS